MGDSQPIQAANHLPLRETAPRKGRRFSFRESYVLAVSYDPTIYQGAAAHYRPGRPAYSPQLESGLAEELGPDGTGRLLDGGCRTRFGVPRPVFASGIPDLLRESESVLSGYSSMATSAPHLFGDRADDFAGEVRELLAARSPEGLFWDWPGDTEILVARRR